MKAHRQNLPRALLKPQAEIELDRSVRVGRMCLAHLASTLPYYP